MRDTDCDLTSVIVVRSESPVRSLTDLPGRVVATGAVDSPQATLLPVDLIGATGTEVTLRRFDIGVGLHGDHIGGERDAARALMAEQVDAACMIDANHLTFTKEGTLPPGGTRIVGQTAPYDHCNFTAIEPHGDDVHRFVRLLGSMSYGDPEARRLFDLEGLTAWRPGRTSGYMALDRAVDAVGFYAADGAVTATEYRP